VRSIAGVHGVHGIHGVAGVYGVHAVRTICSPLTITSIGESSTGICCTQVLQAN